MNEDQGNTVSLGFDQYVFILKRQWRVVFAGAVAGLLAAGVFLVVAPTTVTVTTTLNLNVITTDPFNPQKPASGLLDDATEADIASSHVVAARAAENLGGSTTASEIRRSSTVATSSSASVVKVSYEAATVKQAVAGADAVADAYLSFRSEQAQERIAVMVNNITSSVDTLNETLKGVNKTITTAGTDSVDYAQATTQRAQILSELDDLLSQRNVLQGVDTTGGIVLTAADDSTPEYSPGRTMTLLTGLAAGLILGVIAAFVRNPFDRRLRNTVEIARSLGAPVFAEVDVAQERIPVSGEAADALRVARERMLVDIELGSTVLVVDATHAANISSTAVNLAVVTAQSGFDARLIVPEAGTRVDAALRDALKLGDPDPIRGLRTSRRIRTFSYVSVDAEAGDAQGDPLLTAHVHDVIEATPDDALTFLVLSTAAPHAARLAALRVAHIVVVVAREHSTTATEIEWIREEAEGMGAVVLGAIAERPVKKHDADGVLVAARDHRAADAALS
ncbi:MAG: hypothetical protein QM630_02730 [Microbacterium sp.]